MAGSSPSEGFMYTRDELLDIYKRGDFRKPDYSEYFTHVPNVTTPEILVPLAMIPMSAEEAELRANPIAVPLPAVGRGGGRGFQDREMRGRGRGRGGRDAAWNAPRSSGGVEPHEAYEQRRWASGDVRLDRQPRDSGGSDGVGGAGIPGGAGGPAGFQPWTANASQGDGAAAEAAEHSTAQDVGQPGPLKASNEPPRAAPPLAAPAVAFPKRPPSPKEWFYRDLEGQLQGPFTESQISDWYSLSYLPVDLQMRSSDEPADHYTPLSELVAANGGEPPFVRAHRAQQQYAEEVKRVQQRQQQQQQQQQDQFADEMRRQAEERARAEAAQREAASREAAQREAEALAAAEREAKEREAAEREAAAREAAAREAAALEAAREAAAREAAAREAAALEAAREAAQREAQRAAMEMAQRAAEEEARRQEMHRQMLEEARRRAEEEATELRRQALEEARRVAEEESRRHREELQQRLQAEAEQLARQKAEAAELARRQAHELAMQQAALSEAEEQNRRKAEALARQQAAFEAQKRALNGLPPAGTPGAGSALLSLLQSSDSSGGALAALAGWGGAAQQQGLPSAQPHMVDSSQLEQLWTQSGTTPSSDTLGSGQLASPQGDSLGWGRGRGRGRGVCSAALGTARRGGGEGDALLAPLAPADAMSRALGGLHVGDGQPSPQLSTDGRLDAFLASSIPQEHAARLAADADADVDATRKGRKAKRGASKARGKDGDETMSPAVTDAHSVIFHAHEQAQPSDMLRPAESAPTSSQPAWGWGPMPPQTTNNGRPKSLQEIQEQEERERKVREAKAAAAAAAMQARAKTQPAGSAWGNAMVPGKPPPAVALAPPACGGSQRPSAAVSALLDGDSGMLWDYGSTGQADSRTNAPPPATSQSSAGNGASTFPALSVGQPACPSPASGPGATPSKAKKKKGKDTPESSPSACGNGGQEMRSEGDTFDLDGGQMPPTMARWCEEQMMALTGNSDTTLTQFLFSLASDSEVESYLSMYLGDSRAVTSFAKEFTLQKRAARGTGASREWQTAKPRSKQSPAAHGGDDADASNKGKRKGKQKKAVDPALLGFSVESSRIMQGEIQFVEGM